MCSPDKAISLAKSKKTFLAENEFESYLNEKFDPLKKEENFLAYFNSFKYEKAFTAAEELNCKKYSFKFLTYLRNPLLDDMTHDINYSKRMLYFKKHFSALKNRKISKKFSALKNVYISLLSAYIPGIKERRIKADPKRIWTKSLSGKQNLQKGDFDRAQKELKSFLSLYPFDWESRCYLAETLFFSGRKKESQKEFSIALKEAQTINEKNQILLWQAQFFLFSGEYKKAIKIFEKRDFSQNNFADCWKAAALIFSGNFQKGLFLLKKHLYINPFDIEAILYKAEGFLRKKDFFKAENALNEVLKKSRQMNMTAYDWLTHLLFCSLYLKKGEKEKAFFHLKKIDSFFIKKAKKKFPSLKNPLKLAETILKTIKASRRPEKYIFLGLLKIKN